MGYTKAPLPFQGQKRNWVKEFRDVLRNWGGEKITTVVDLFGGSGLLSRIAKDTLPDARVIYNDYDGFSDRIAAIPETNKILLEIAEIIADLPKRKLIPKPIKSKLLKRLEHYDCLGYVDWITISAAITFSGRFFRTFPELTKGSLYNNLKHPKVEYSPADDYLDGLEVANKDYRELLNEYKWDSHSLIIADPPYLTTDCGSYKSGCYWRLTDSLTLLSALNGKNFIYFTSDRSQIIELCQWLESTYGDNPLDGRCYSRRVTINHAAGYEDFMIVKQK